MSPASLGLCCLAVMAPALTKADRRSDCLPVVLTDPFCESKTATPYNRKDKFIEANLPKLSSKFACFLNNRRKAYIHKTWFRTHLKNNSPGYCFRSPFPPSDIYNGKIDAEFDKETWHGTSVTLAVADKVRLKYTMNKNTNSLKNMGLSRTSASLGMHNMKKVNRITQFSPQDKSNPSTPDMGESSPDLLYSADSVLETGLSDIGRTLTCLEKPSEDVSPSCGDSEISTVTEQLPNSDCTVTKQLPNSDCTVTEQLHNSDCTVTKQSPSSDCTVIEQLPNSDNSATEQFLNSNCTITEKLLNTDCAVSDQLPNSVCAVTEQLPNVKGCVSFPAASDASGKFSITTLSDGVDLPLTSEDINLSLPVKLTDSECAVTNVDVEMTLVSDPTSADLPDVPPSIPEKLRIVSSLPQETCVDTCSESSASSTITQSSNHNVNLSSNNSFHPNCEISSPETSQFANLNFDPNDFAVSVACPVGVKEITSSLQVAQLTSNRPEKPDSQNTVPINRDCCPVDYEALIEENSDDECLNRILAAIEKSELLVRICISAYSKKEIGELVKSYQNKLGIPCQKQLKYVNSSRELINAKSELLQHDDVKSLSTAALVNLVKNFESTGSSGNLLHRQSLSSGVDVSSTDAVLAFSAEDVADVMHASTELLGSIKKELTYVDPDLTESSDSECEQEQEIDSVPNMTLWKFMKERAALTCRATWLIARIHELENQLRTTSGSLQKITSTMGDVCFEDKLATCKSVDALSDPILDDANVETVSKKCKGLTGPVNGFLDNNHKSNIAHIGQTSLVESFQLNKDQTETAEEGYSDQCSRTRALKVSTFQKRDLLVTTGLHLTDNKLAKLSTMDCHCSCNDEILPCVLCMGRYQCVQSIDPVSMPILDRVSILDSNFHPLLSFYKDVPLILHFESILKKNESQYQIERPASPPPSLKISGLDAGSRTFSTARSRSLKLNRYARTYFSEKYRYKHLRNNKHLRKHGLVFGKWRRYQTKRPFQARERIRRISIDSSGSSQDSPIPSPGSIYDESYDSIKRKREENQFDIDDVIIPYSNKSARLVDFEFKDIIVPSFRIEGNKVQNFLTEPSDVSKELNLVEEGTNEETYLARHNHLEVEEKKINRRPVVLNVPPNPKRIRRDHRFDSRADSSGANTPDPVLFSDQDMFHDQNSMTALSPPATPSSNNLPSDDSQPSFMSSLMARLERSSVKRLSEESTSAKLETEEIAPYELRSFPLSDQHCEEIFLDPYCEDMELTVSGRSSPASPGSTTLSTSTIDEITNPEWMVLRNNPTHEPSLKLKLAKR